MLSPPVIALAAGVLIGLTRMTHPWRILPRRAPERERREAASSPRIGDVMLPAAGAVSEEMVVAEARDYFAGSDAGARPVVDHDGHPVGILRRETVEAIPLLDRSSRLVAEIADRDGELIAESQQEARAVLDRPAVRRTGFAMVTDDHRRLVGVARSPLR